MVRVLMSVQRLMEEDYSEITRLLSNQRKGVRLSNAQLGGIPVYMKWKALSMTSLEPSWLDRAAQCYKRPLSKDGVQLVGPEASFYYVTNLDVSSNMLSVSKPLTTVFANLDSS